MMTMTSTIVGVRLRIPTADYMCCAPRGGPAHKTKTYGVRYCSACTTRHQGRYPEDTTRSVRICSIP